MRSIFVAGLLVASVGIAALAALGTPARAAEYLAATGCQACHEALVKGWATTRHARAFDSLKKSHQEGLPACVACHVTGYEKSGGFLDQELTPELAGVQCEECHGPGGAHAADPGQAGSMTAKPGEAVCRRCHTASQDPGFAYGEKIRLIHGR